MRPIGAWLAVALLASAMPALGQTAGGGDDDPPALTTRGPTGVVSNGLAEVRARYRDESGVVPASVVLTVDGRRLPANGTETEVAYAPHVPWSAGPHEARILAADRAGNVLNATWRFVIVPPDVRDEVSYDHAARAEVSTPLTLRIDNLLLDRVEVTPAATVTNLTLVARRMQSLPPTLAAPPAEPLTLVDLEAVADGTTSPSVAALRVHAAVPAGVLEAYGATARQVVPLEARGGAWRPLLVTVGAPNATVARYAMSPVGFGPLALVADVAAPTVAPVAPVDGALLRELPDLRARVTDNVAVDAVAATLDGGAVGAALADGIVSVAPPAAVVDGRHTLEVRAVDVGGNAGSRAWTFLLDREGPSFPRALPAGVAASARPRMEVVMVDDVSGVDAATLRARLDGEDVTSAVALVAEVVRYDPPRDLAAGAHVFEVVVSDRAGNSATLAHGFEVAARSAIPLGLAPLALAVGVAFLLARRR